MSRALLHAGLATALLIGFATSAHAACGSDNDCKGDRICEDGACVDPPTTARLASKGSPAAQPAQPALLPAPAPALPPPRLVRHSTGMMVGGIVMVSLSPVAFLLAAAGAIGQSFCNIDASDSSSCHENDTLIVGSLITGIGLVGGGIPLIVIGAHKEPAEPEARIQPWATRSAAGLALQLDL